MVEQPEKYDYHFTSDEERESFEQLSEEEKLRFLEKEKAKTEAILSIAGERFARLLNQRKILETLNISDETELHQIDEELHKIWQESEAKFLKRIETVRKAIKEAYSVMREKELDYKIIKIGDRDNPYTFSYPEMEYLAKEFGGKEVVYCEIQSRKNVGPLKSTYEKENRFFPDLPENDSLNRRYAENYVGEIPLMEDNEFVYSLTGPVPRLEACRRDQYRRLPFRPASQNEELIRAWGRMANDVEFTIRKEIQEREKGQRD